MLKLRLAALLAGLALPFSLSGGIKLPEGFIEETVVPEISAATAFSFLPDGRILLCEQKGRILVHQDGKLLPEPLLELEVDHYWERGIIGLAIDPDFENEPWIYVFYATNVDFPKTVISRFKIDGNRALRESEEVLIEGKDQLAYGGFKPAGHQGGVLAFGPDGKLYIGTGEYTASWPSQSLETIAGKVLRINKDGTIPSDNPYYDQLEGVYRSIYSTGIRNPFGLVFEESTGDLYLTDVGQTAYEEVNVIVKGGNYGWPEEEGPPTKSDTFESIAPIHAFTPAIGQSIVGGEFYEGSQLPYPEEYHGKFFFMDYMANWVNTLDPKNPEDVQTFATGLAGPVAIHLGPEGDLYYLNRNAWVYDGRLQPHTGSLRRISYVGEEQAVLWRKQQDANKPSIPTEDVSEPKLALSPPSGVYTGPIQVNVAGSLARDPKITIRYTLSGALPDRWSPLYEGGLNISKDQYLVVAALDESSSVVQSVRADYRVASQTPYGLNKRPRHAEAYIPDEIAAFPKNLSELGIFADLASSQPIEGFIPYRLTNPVWEPYVSVKRWLSVPDFKHIEFLEQGRANLPPGSLILQHFDLTPNNASRIRLETRLIRVGQNDTHQAVTYLWKEDQSDARLSETMNMQDLSAKLGLPAGDRSWITPGPMDNLSFDNPRVFYYHDISVAQLNAPVTYPQTGVSDNQIRTWNHIGLFDTRIEEALIPRLPSFAAIGDPNSSIEHQVRSYLHTNCASCHHPEGNVRSNFDARIQTNVWGQGLLWSKAATPLYGFDAENLIQPGYPEKSILIERLRQHSSPFKMPSPSLYKQISPIVPIMDEWILELGRKHLSVKLDENAIDESAGNLACFKITTPTATYYLEKSGGGLSSLLDTSGNDWLGFEPTKGSGAKGEYRGFPNAVHQQAGSYFHAMNSGTDPCITEVLENRGDHVSISVRSESGHWAGRYDFYGDRSTFTMTQMPEDKAYWILYEGTPGGSFDLDDWWMTSSQKEPQPMTAGHKGDISNPEWIAFGDPDVDRSLLLVSHTDDDSPDTFYQMQESMTVFGFGRQGLEKFLKTVPQTFTLSFVESKKHEKISERAEELLK
ncbi:PQQ-dependent sugar dehydrogenase [Pelagicoccus mobilis]|uniref:PQQ-dependent sugar dehydrogenase n=1 Tax=Pelagicoccus mobilis TaxID=415221 RepID=A0A934VR68_9BACT|nr:PQQ-dependent sugar dehydrogenase [Pelagicoccus mobilis]MBK1879082.1 PQQ-dependent sugar dehydrogenase [Pelagicoccus mobilis]